MKKITIFGVSICGGLRGDNNKLMFLTNFSKHLPKEISRSVKETKGNILMAEIPQKTNTIYGGKTIPISLEKNRNILREAIISSMTSEEQEIVDYNADENDFDPFVQVSQETTKEVRIKIQEIIDSNNISVVIVGDLALAESLTSALIERFGRDNISFFTDERTEDYVSHWNEWRRYCREMQFFDEFPETFAGLKIVPFAGMDNKGRPRNDFYQWDLTKKKNVAA